MKWEKDLIRDIRTFTDFDDSDSDIQMPMNTWGCEVTSCNRESVKFYMNQLLRCSAILEIGISRNGYDSITQVFLNNKSKECKYLGVDIDDKSYLNDVENNTYTIQTNSSNYDDVVSYAKSIGIMQFDFIFIDGWHSINQVLDDWEYTNLLSQDGVVGFHDVNYHPGPKYFVANIDNTIWEYSGNLCDDYGIGFLKRK